MRGRLSGFRYRDATRRLQRRGSTFRRQGAGSHEVWIGPAGQHVLTANHPRDIAEGTVRPILRQAGISPDDFLAD